MANKAKKASRNNGPDFLRPAFEGVQKVLIEKLKQSSASITHDATMGAVNENHWIKVFRAYLPNRYAVNTGIVLDSEGTASDQIDIIIYDHQYTPELLTQNQHRYIPAEAVYAVFEAKPDINKKYLEYAGNKAASVRKLKKTTVPIVHAGGEFPAKPTIEIISGIVALKAAWKDGLGKTFKTNIEKLKGIKRLDCGIALEHGSFDYFDSTKSYTLGDKKHGLIFFLFRLLGKLQALGTVPAIDWNAYVKLFRKS